MTSNNIRSILLVDDDEISNLFNRIFIRKLNLDIEVEIASNGKDALDFLEKVNINATSDSNQFPCLLLLDIKMPKMNGWQFLKAFENNFSQAMRNNIVIVMLTTSQDEGDMIEAINNPIVKKFIQKPLSEEKFTQLIGTYFTNTNS